MHRDGDRLLQLLIFNEEYLVGACHQRASITSLPFVHTARRSYRLNDPVRPPDCGNAAGSPAAMPREAVQTLSFRGRRSRNKVSVGEPAEGSLTVSFHSHPLGTVHPGRSAVAPFAGVGGVARGVGRGCVVGSARDAGRAGVVPSFSRRHAGRGGVARARDLSCSASCACP